MNDDNTTFPECEDIDVSELAITIEKQTLKEIEEVLEKKYEEFDFEDNQEKYTSILLTDMFDIINNLLKKIADYQKK